MKTLIILLTIFLNSISMANEKMIATVINLRGVVKATLTDGKIIDVKIDQSIPEGATLNTSEKSFVKLIFIDKSQMNLGPNSQMVISAFPKKEAGIITLVKGQIRSQVTKDYMEMDDKSKSKLFIKTTSAAMGIRGTDFQVNFNPENLNTTLITFEGKVAMSHIDKNEREEKFDQSKLESIVSSDKAVFVVKGQISQVNLNVSERAMAPTELGAKQIEALKVNETGLNEKFDSSKNDDKKSKENNNIETASQQFKSPIPPGADGELFSKEGMKNNSQKQNFEEKNNDSFFNNKTGEYKLPPGSIVDLNTLNIIPPPANALFDPNTKTFIVPENYGKIDAKTGSYLPPEGLKLGNDGKFVLVDANAFAKSQVVVKNSTDGRQPASETNSLNPNQVPANLNLPKIYDANPDMQKFANQFGQAIPGMKFDPNATFQMPNDFQKQIINDRLNSTDIIKQNNPVPVNTIMPNSRVNFNFNVP